MIGAYKMDTKTTIKKELWLSPHPFSTCIFNTAIQFNSIQFNSLYLALKSYDMYNKNNIRLGAPEETLYGLVR